MTRAFLGSGCVVPVRRSRALEGLVGGAGDLVGYAVDVAQAVRQ